MDPAALRDALAELARECGIAVRVLRAEAEGLASGPARVRGAAWVVLVASDPPRAQAEALAAGIARFAPGAADARFLPPAVREALERAAAR